MKPLQLVEEENVVTDVQEILIILKWGGELTHKGKEQAEELGEYRKIFLYIWKIFYL